MTTSAPKSRFRIALANSLPVRAWLAVWLIMGLALGTAIFSGMLAWVAESDAHAVNTAGSIRMATYRANYLLASDYQAPYYIDKTLTLDANQPIAPQLNSDMQQRLTTLSHYEQSQGNNDPQIQRQIEHLQQMWTHQLSPLLLTNHRQGFYPLASQYIDEVDELVKHIQARNEQRQTWQQNLQTISLLLTVVIMFVGLYELQQNVLLPVQQLRQATQQFRQRKSFETVQVNIAGYEEFNELGASFNEMTHTLELYQNHLEQQVERKTYHLTQSNQALRLLYDFAKELSSATITYPKLQTLIEQFSQVMPHLHLTLCLRHADVLTKDAIALHSTQHQHAQDVCEPRHCEQCEFRRADTWVYPIHSQTIEWGELLVVRANPASVVPVKGDKIPLINISHDAEPSFDEKALLNTLTNLIAMVFATQRQREQEHQLLLFEERNTIARELHDSLAQSLSYLKMQIALLANLLKQFDLPASEQQQRIEQVMNQTRDGLNDAYSQLRELLVTFRLKIDEGSFDTALAQACEEFAEKGNFKVNLDNRLMSLNLTASEQIDLLQISREALSNINRHAHASHVHVSLTQNQQGEVILRVQDDGVGLNPDFDHRQHHGLKIMQERSHNLGGDFHIDNVLPHGTAVAVKFLPTLFE
ncbi:MULTISPECIES: histidine kinase [unclassified Moraxella]|uniref:histidine kinase n=1 Tax=unclassified Moraxella TaxID=2685852 RepID=UPI003AF97E35